MPIFHNQHNLVQILNTKLTSLQTYDDPNHVEDSFNFNLWAHNPHNLDVQGIQEKEIAYHVLPIISMGWIFLIVLGCVEKVIALLKKAPW
jgi:hypothetical protein